MSSVLAADNEIGLEAETGATTVTLDKPSEEPADKAYQKLQGENDRLRTEVEKGKTDFDAFKQVMQPKEKLFNTFQNNPKWWDIAKDAITDYESGGEPTKFIPDEDFVPDEAYRQGTPSYRFREEQEDTRIQKAVNAALGDIREERLVDETREKLVEGGMAKADARDYMAFLNDPEAFPGGKDLLMGAMAKAFTQSKSGDDTAAAEVAETQASFPSAGAYSGGAEAPKSVVDTMMDKILVQGAKRSILT